MARPRKAVSRPAGPRRAGPRKPGRRPAAPRKRRGFPWKRIALVLFLGLAVALAWLIWPFWQLAGQFGTQPTKQPSRLYGRPFELSVGRVLGAEDLAARLEEAGYRRVDDPGDLAPGSFRQDGGTVEVFRRRFSTAGGPDGGDRLEVGFRGRTIAAISSSGERTSRAPGAGLPALLDPPLVTSYYGPDLKERRPIGLDALPEDLILAVLAAEDARFLEHKGVSLKAILRAAWVNLWAREVRQGGSTLTQQLVKNLYLTHERKLARKLREAVLAILLELRFDKRAIFQAYLNEIYWGRSGSVNLMGVGAAAWAYLGKRPAELTLGESALLAGMIQSPTHLSPLDHPEAAERRRDVVLGRLVQLQWVSEERAAAASREPVAGLRAPLVVRRAPYFAAAAAAEARRRFGVPVLEDAGYTLHSTLDVGDQEQAEEAVVWGVEALEGGWEKGRKTATPLQAALISVDPRDGGIRAYVGGRDFAVSQFDRVGQARRQAGSAFKPIVYAAAYRERVAHPATLLEDAPLVVELAGQRWSPRNYDGKHRGMVTTRAALEQSLNVPTARLANRVGLERIVALARRLGIEGRLDPFPALALGAMEVTPRELATVYATLAAGGLRPALHTLLAVHDREGRPLPGQPLPAPERALAEDLAFVVTSVLQGVLDRGTGKSARQQGIEDPVAGKTGTTNDRRDSWFAGYSPDRATLVWVGYDDNATTRLSGARAALPIWSRFAYRVRPAGGYPEFAAPAGVAWAFIDPVTGGLATDRCPEVVTEVFLADFLPEDLCPDHSGLRARPLEQPEGVGKVKKEHPFKRWLRMLRKKQGAV